MSAREPIGAQLRGAVDLSSLAAPRPQPGAAPGQAASAAPGGAPSVPALIVDGTDATFNDYLELSRTVPVIVDLWASWCEPCKQLTPILEKLITEYAGRLVLVKIDVDANPQLSQAFAAQSIPTVAAVIGGRPLQLFTGAVPEAQVRDVFEQVLQAAAQNGVSGVVTVAGAEGAPPAPVEPPLPPLHAEAYDAIEQGDYPRAITAYKTAIAQNPSDAYAVAGLAQVSLLWRLGGKTLEDIRSRAAAEPTNLDAQFDVVDLDVSGGHVDDGFDRLLTLFADADSADRNAIRSRMLELFEVVGAEDSRVVRARGRLANLLY